MTMTTKQRQAKRESIRSRSAYLNKSAEENYHLAYTVDERLEGLIQMPKDFMDDDSDMGRLLTSQVILDHFHALHPEVKETIGVAAHFKRDEMHPNLQLIAHLGFPTETSQQSFIEWLGTNVPEAPMATHMLMAKAGDQKTYDGGTPQESTWYPVYVLVGDIDWLRNGDWG